MILKRKPHYKELQKKLIRLKANPLSNHKFLKLILQSTKKKKIYEIVDGRIKKRTIIIKRFAEIPKKKRKKWGLFLRLLEKSNKFFQKYRPYTFHKYKVSKLASPGNSFIKQYKNDLFTKKIFTNYYGNLKKKYLKKQMTEIFKSSKHKKNYKNICVEFFESRLDSVLRKSNFCSTIKEARQMIRHRHIKVNGIVENNYAHILKQGDSVMIKPCSHSIIRSNIRNKFTRNFNLVIWPMHFEYLNINYRTLEIIFGNINKTRFSSSFPFRLGVSRVVESCSRH